MGKSLMLNKLFESDFELSKDHIFHEGFDILFTSEEYELGFNVIDMHGDVLEHFELFVALQVLPEDIWIVIHFSYNSWIELFFEAI